jgi:CheY-like chemotaxis protein
MNNDYHDTCFAPAPAPATASFGDYSTLITLPTDSGTVSGSRRQLSAHIEARLEDGRRPASARARVLHVDSDADAALLLCTLLMPEAEVSHVYTLQAALRLIGRGHYDLLVLDPALSDGDGAVLFETLKAAGAATPVLLYASDDTVWRDQASAFLLKPWASPRQLWGAASKLLGLTQPALPAVQR